MSLDSTVQGHVAQFDSLTAVGTLGERPLYARALARVAARLEPGKVRTRNDRYDLGVLLALGPQSYVSAGLAFEDTDVDSLSATASGSVWLGLAASSRPTWQTSGTPMRSCCSTMCSKPT